MKKIIKLIVASFLLIPVLLTAQNAPVSSIPDTNACPGSSITLPIRVSNFSSIGSLGLKIQYNTENLTFTGWSNVSGFPGLSLNSSQPGMLVLGGFTFTTGGFTLPNNSVFINITFFYTGGIAPVTWFENGPSCEWTGPAFSFPVLNDLPTNIYYINGGISPLLVPGFSSSNLLPLLNDTVTLYDESVGASSWSWNISPAGYFYVNGTTEFSQNPQIVFTGNGAYSVSLTVTNGSCVQTLEKVDYIHAGTPGLWTGQFSSDWFEAGNWHNWVIPDQDVSVVIPSYATHWPEFEGNFTLGSNCHNLTIQGANGIMTVTGDFILP